MSDKSSPRVNSAMLSKYVGRTVRLTCKVIKVSVLPQSSLESCVYHPLRVHSAERRGCFGSSCGWWTSEC